MIFFSFNTSEVTLVHDNSLFFSGLDNVTYEKTDLLIKAKKGKELSNIKMEIDFGILSLGKSFYLSYLPNSNSEIRFENYLLNKFGCINEKYYNTFFEVIKNEDLGLIDRCSYTFDEVLEEDVFLFDCKEGWYSLHFDENQNFNMMYIFQNCFYDVYIDGKKNQKFISSRKIYDEFNSYKWQNLIKKIVNMQMQRLVALTLLMEE